MYFTSPLTLLLVILIVVFVMYIRYEQKKSDSINEQKLDGNVSERDITLLEAPGPKTYPIIGNLHVLGGYEVPYQAFTALAEKYGSIIKLKLGSVHAIVVNGQDNIKEVLMTKGHHFDSRPNFERYHQLFCGDKENSLAFCDFSDVQKMRREMLRSHTFPRSFSVKFNNLDTIISTEVTDMISRVTSNEKFEIKPLILQTCANVFASHFCSKNFSTDDQDFLTMIKDFDDIFYEVNQGYAADFLPFLMPFHKNRLGHMRKLTHRIRHFIETKIIEDRFDAWTSNSKPDDYVESLIYHVKTESVPKMSWDTALFALEDIIGGHAAVGNFLTKILGYLVQEPEVQRKIQEEVDACTKTLDGKNRQVTISDRTCLPYTEAVILEAIRLIASPIVPRVANQESSVAGFRVQKDTLIFLNNYELSMSEKLWDSPKKFQPERFLQKGRLVKPEHFLPFGVKYIEILVNLVRFLTKL
ncbi:spookier [Carabus blaptoides fortunei]